MNRPENIIESGDYIEPWTFKSSEEQTLFIAYQEQELYIDYLEGRLNTTGLEISDDDFIQCDVVVCCKRGPITDEKYCPYCGKFIIRQ